VRDARLDIFELLARTPEVRLCRYARERGPVAHAFEIEVELNAIAALRADAAGYRPSTHLSYPTRSMKMRPSGARLQTLPFLPVAALDLSLHCLDCVTSGFGSRFV